MKRILSEKKTTACGNKKNTISSENKHEIEDEVSDDSRSTFASFSFMCRIKISSAITVLSVCRHVFLSLLPN